ncbi:MAG: hypothetical protein ACLFTT_17565 [Candidatus Hydrogenedentota bacterium]
MQEPPVSESYLIRRKVLKFVGGAFHVYDAQGNLIAYSRQKAFKLKEDIRLFTDESMETELLRINARAVIDFSAAYDVYDSTTGECIGGLRRHGFKSLLRDAWALFDAEENQLGTIAEDNMTLALVRRFITNVVPQRFTAKIGDTPVCDFTQNFNPFVRKLQVTYRPESAGIFDRRLGMAAGVLLVAIEGAQQ